MRCRSEVIYLENEQYLVEADNLKKYYHIPSEKLFERKKYAKAVDGISFKIKKGEIFGIVGESGSGKSTTGKMLMRLTDVTEGKIKFEGKDITKLKGRELRKMRSEFQIVFQDPYSALNPRKRIGWILEEPLKIQGVKSKTEREKRVSEILKLLGFDDDFKNKYPHELSGGQRQRVVIGCALMLKPKFIVADEPVSALDVSVQSQILNFMRELHEKFKITFLFISHNLNVVHYMCDRVGVMYLGRLVEIGEVEDIYASPLHPYTKALISAIPDLKSKLKIEDVILNGEISSLSIIPTGCPFHTRCPDASEICRNAEPEMKNVSHNGKEHYVRCHRVK